MDLIGDGTDNTWVLAGPNGRVISGIECITAYLGRPLIGVDIIILNLDIVEARELRDLLFSPHRALFCLLFFTLLFTWGLHTPFFIFACHSVTLKSTQGHNI